LLLSLIFTSSTPRTVQPDELADTYGDAVGDAGQPDGNAGRWGPEHDGNHNADDQALNSTGGRDTATARPLTGGIVPQS